MDERNPVGKQNPFASLARSFCQIYFIQLPHTTRTAQRQATLRTAQRPSHAPFRLAAWYLIGYYDYIFNPCNT